jgi:hypothetical protein
MNNNKMSLNKQPHMKSFSKQLSFRWSDLTLIFMCVSAYYDFGAQHRIEILRASAWP